MKCTYLLFCCWKCPIFAVYEPFMSTYFQSFFSKFWFRKMSPIFKNLWNCHRKYCCLSSRKNLYGTFDAKNTLHRTLKTPGTLTYIRGYSIVQVWIFSTLKFPVCQCFGSVPLPVVSDLGSVLYRGDIRKVLLVLYASIACAIIISPAFGSFATVNLFSISTTRHLSSRMAKFLPMHCRGPRRKGM